MRLPNQARAFALSALFIFPLLIPQSANAASGDECAIWMCLPTGFMTGCSGARKAFLKRIKRFKPPLPSFTSCLVSSPATMASQDVFTSDHGVAAYIPAQEVCTRYQTTGKDSRTCVESYIKPEQYLKKQYCHRDNRNDYSNPRGCTGTVKYSEVYRNGELYGEPYYY